MNRHFRKVLEVLKTRKEIKALGFSRKEIKGIAAKVADKLDLEDDASDEDVTKAIDEEVNAAIDVLQFAQSAADRRFQQYKDSLDADEDDDDDDDDDQDDEPVTPKGRKSPSSKKGKSGKGEDDSLAAQLAKALSPRTETINSLKGQVEELKSGKTADSRKARLEAIVKDTGKYGERVMKSFARMSFKTEEDFEDFLDEVEADLEAENQDRLDKGLETLSKPAGAMPGSTVKKDDEEVMSDDEVKELAKG
jgi:hypothetical protein